MLMPSFSLIMATRGRTNELNHFFDSLTYCGSANLECIIVDQNLDDRLLPVLAQWQRHFAIKHLRAAQGLSRARNIGLHHATGDVVAFPDDDCWYSPELLREVASFFSVNRTYQILSVGVRDETNAPSGNRWILDACDLTTTNLFRTSVGFALFVQRGRSKLPPIFDESLGVGAGTPFVSGEDTDYVFRLLESGLRGRFDRRLTVHHPRRDMMSGQANLARAYGYGCGMGRVIRKRAKHSLLPAFLAFDLARTMYSLVNGELSSASRCAAHGRGVFAGFMAPQ
jgi:glycosyltransferase involved in cell wall biosynthesis